MTQNVVVAAASVLLLAAGCASTSIDASSPRTATIDWSFAGPSLDPAWSVAFTNPGSTAVNAIGWRREFSSGALVVTSIEPATHAGGWSYVSLGRSLGGLATDFSLSLSMGWKSVGATDMKNLFLTVYADDASVLGQILYHDAWTATRGQWAALPSYPLNGFWPATKTPGWVEYESGPGTLFDFGTEKLTIARTAGVMSLRIGGTEVLSYAATKCAARVEVSFGYAYDPESTFGELRGENLSGVATLVPPASAACADEAAPPPPPPASNVVEERWFQRIDGTFEKEERVDLGGADVLFFRYGPISDSGVELERTSDGKTLWRVHVEHLGVAHSMYRHDVKVRVEGDRIVVNSVGARRIHEVRDLATGRRISREITDVPR